MEAETILASSEDEATWRALIASAVVSTAQCKDRTGSKQSNIRTKLSNRVIFVIPSRKQAIESG